MNYLGVVLVLEIGYDDCILRLERCPKDVLGGGSEMVGFRWVKKKKKDKEIGAKNQTYPEKLGMSGLPADLGDLAVRTQGTGDLPIGPRQEQFHPRAPLVAFKNLVIGDLYIELVATFNLKRHTCNNLAVKKVICVALIYENSDGLLLEKSHYFHRMWVGVAG
ncbi:hypothetical protein BHM03_00003408 [Ensete ventricosum]|uniref:Uncharacterized protein n=1 Tax=Ensete ventricosum TaxID=4639 RepID=A0A445MA14_ENSVE|nr:hypothetical protein BHM03_00003408 [Ensete ventricosum]